MSCLFLVSFLHIIFLIVTSILLFLIFSTKVESATAYKEQKPVKFSPSDMPMNQTFQYLNYDFPLESVWKIMSFTHYYCARQFSKNPSDHSQLMMTLISFFNEELLKRW